MKYGKMIPAYVLLFSMYGCRHEPSSIVRQAAVNITSTAKTDEPSFEKPVLNVINVPESYLPCIRCHGIDGSGIGTEECGAQLAGDFTRHPDFRQRLTKAVRNGIPDKMPAFPKYTYQQLVEIESFLRVLTDKDIHYHHR